MQEDANSSSEVKCSYRFLKRVYSYQVVSSTFERARTLYENAKRSNALVGRACTLAEQTVVVAVEHLGVPIVTRYDEQLKRLDNVCFTQLATIEQLAESTCLRVRTQCTRLQSGYASALWAVGQVRGGLQKRADGAWEQLANENVTDRPTMLPLRLARVSFQLAQLWYHSVNAIVQKLYDASLFQAVQNSVSRFIRAVSQFDPLQSLAIDIDVREFQIDFDDDIDEEALASLSNVEWLVAQDAGMHVHQPGNFQRSHAGRNHVIQRQRFRLVSSSRTVTLNIVS